VLVQKPRCDAKVLARTHIHCPTATHPSSARLRGGAAAALLLLLLLPLPLLLFLLILLLRLLLLLLVLVEASAAAQALAQERAGALVDDTSAFYPVAGPAHGALPCGGKGPGDLSL
jgi:hypothetical protein